MKLISKTTGETIATITTNHRMTIEEALSVIGAEPTSGGMDIPDYTFGGKDIWIDEIDLID
jgi:hypothetical protein